MNIDSTTFSRGNIVRLRSGSPDLTVVGIFGEGTVDPNIDVAWYSPDGALHRAELPAAALELSPTRGSAPIGPQFNVVASAADGPVGIALGDGD